MLETNWIQGLCREVGSLGNSPDHHRPVLEMKQLIFFSDLQRIQTEETVVMKGSFW